MPSSRRRASLAKRGCLLATASATISTTHKPRCDLDPVSGYYTRCSGTARDQIQVMGYSVRTQAWRFTEWFRYDGNRTDFDATVATELYDHRGDQGGDMDAYEQDNVVDDPRHKAVVAQHRRILREGWRKQLPPL